MPIGPDTPRCGARTPTGTCGRVAGWGTDHVGRGCCRKHGGNTRNHRNKSFMEEVTAVCVKEMVMGYALEVEPHEALLVLVRVAAGEVAYCSKKVAELREEDALVRPSSHRVTKGHNGEGTFSSFEEREDPVELNIWIRARHACMDRLARYSKLAVDSGVEERTVRIAEQQASLITVYLEQVFKELNLTEQQRQLVGPAMRNHMDIIEGTEAA